MPRHLITAGWYRPNASFMLALLFFVLGLLFLYSFAHFVFKAFGGFAWDFTINWTAALALHQNIPLYDAPALQTLAVTHIDGGMRQLFNGPFQRYISLPTTAMLLQPFRELPFELAVPLYRSVMVLALVTGTWLAARSHHNTATPLFSLLASLTLLALWQPAITSVQLGQMDGWIVLALGISLWATARNTPWLAGIGIGMAALLKISPAVLLCHCLLRRQWSTVLTGTVTILAGLFLCTLPPSGSDLATFVSQVMPALQQGTAHIQNQSLGAALARLAADSDAVMAFSSTAGLWQWAGLLPAALVLPWLAWTRRALPLHPQELGCCILLALLAGPISWDHYTSWALLPATLLLTSSHTRWLALPASLPFLFTLSTTTSSDTAWLTGWLYSNAYAIGCLLLLLPCLWQLLRQYQPPTA